MKLANRMTGLPAKSVGVLNVLLAILLGLTGLLLGIALVATLRGLGPDTPAAVVLCGLLTILFWLRRLLARVVGSRQGG